jgi:hypothetical protein
MAITRAQQAKQMLQNGGMLVQPGFGGTRQGYRGDDAYGGSEASKGDGPETGADSLGDLNRETRMGDKGKTRSDKTDKGEGLKELLTPTNIFKGLISLKTKVPTFGINLFNTKKGIKDPNVYEQAKLDFFTDDDDDTVEPGGEGEYIPPTFAQTQIAPGTVAPVMPMQRPMDLNRLAYRFFADGGFLEDTDEERQAYGLGSFVRKITRPIKKVAKKTVSTVKKVAKSPVGRLAIAVAAPYALGPAFGTGVMGSLSAAQKAALISGATTGITQLASDEDLDFKDIALSAALSGATAKAFPPGGAPKADPTGIAGRARVASDISAGAIPDRAMGQIRPRFFDADDVVLATQKPNLISSQIQKGIIPDRGMGQIFERAVPKDTSIFQKGKNIFKAAKDSKALDFIKENPLLTILGTSALAGITAKKQQEPEEFRDEDRGPSLDIEGITARPFDTLRSRFAGSEFDFYAADGGRIGYQKGSKEPVAKKVMPLLDMGGMEKDYREDGGFVPIGRMEKADDVPARLSKNEFVFTADAVRNAGDGNVDKGAEVMYNMMKNLEAGGDVSEESQGLEGARKMFQTSQRLEEVL